MFHKQILDLTFWKSSSARCRILKNDLWPTSCWKQWTWLCNLHGLSGWWWWSGDASQTHSTRCTSLLDCDDSSLKYKIVYIAGYSVCKYDKSLRDAGGKEVISTEHLTELNQQSSRSHYINSVFVLSAYQGQSQIFLKKWKCRSCLKCLFVFVNVPTAKNTDTCSRLTNIILKTFILNYSDREKNWDIIEGKKS